MLLIGVTGGIGAGKTTVLREFQQLGARVLEADAVVHELYTADESVRDALRRRWGEAAFAPDESVDRAAVASIVFECGAELDWLNQLVHPLVKEKILACAAEAPSALFCSVPLLFEAGWEASVCRTVTVWCDAATQRERLQQRGWSAAETTRRLAHQMCMDEKLWRAEYAVINTGRRALLGEQCRRVFARITGR